MNEQPFEGKWIQEFFKSEINWTTTYSCCKGCVVTAKITQ